MKICCQELSLDRVKEGETKGQESYDDLMDLQRKNTDADDGGSTEALQYAHVSMSEILLGIPRR